jgi:hypothetical protein
MNALWITTMILASVGCAVGQDVPPPPPMRGDAATLKDTMKFIQDKLPGKVNYILYRHDNIAGTDLPALKQSFELSNVSADAGRCSISGHLRFDNGQNVVDIDSVILLKEFREITLAQLELVIQREDAKAGRPERSVKVDPPIFTVVGIKHNGDQGQLNFYDETLADRVSKALQHAMELCGGGSQEPF